jgi:hypothetical protein
MIRKGGGFDTIQVPYFGGHEVGYPIRSLWARDVQSYDAATNTHERTAYSVYRGPVLPTFTASIANTLTYGSFRLYGLVSTEQGAVFSNSDRPYRARQGGGDEMLSLFDFNNRDANGNPTPTTKSDSVLNYLTLASAYDSRDHVRLREVSLSYTVPLSFTNQFGLGRTVLTVSGQNLHWWDDCNCLDPNMQYQGGSSFGSSGFLAMPQSRKFLFSVRTGFGG